jgi:hypothetical protein
MAIRYMACRHVSVTYDYGAYGGRGDLVLGYRRLTRSWSDLASITFAIPGTNVCQARVGADIDQAS